MKTLTQENIEKKAARVPANTLRKQKRIESQEPKEENAAGKLAGRVPANNLRKKDILANRKEDMKKAARLTRIQKYMKDFNLSEEDAIKMFEANEKSNK